MRGIKDTRSALREDVVLLRCCIGTYNTLLMQLLQFLHACMIDAEDLRQSAGGCSHCHDSSSKDDLQNESITLVTAAISQAGEFSVDGNQAASHLPWKSRDAYYLRQIGRARPESLRRGLLLILEAVARH